MKPDSSEWRSSQAYDFISDVTPDALAWEFLRRNPAYQREFADMQQINPTPNSLSPNELRSQWGLRFSSKS
ncbi:hypothetical protein CO731_03118 [Aminobacter sp. MSH1]|uniref:transcriptional regulator domain-containing protein n=1 Tax=unclassified Aminobacter TaxID=2644704 RepID=UPI000B2E3E89|nr:MULTISPECIES: DUF6499 domain-containing protein [unclassified Aminobacter]AWC23646.1 hypothetical protein CO731_03118 [Aminobacter sp. MSH1]